MFYVIHCVDKADSLHVRMDNRPSHVEYLKSNLEILHGAGALLNDQEQMCGSIIILDVADKAAAEAFAAGDPYAKAGLFASVTIDRWNKVLP